MPYDEPVKFQGQVEMDFDKMGYEALMEAEGNKGPNSQNGIPDLVWEDKKTGCGIYVGDIQCA